MWTAQSGRHVGYSVLPLFCPPLCPGVGVACVCVWGMSHGRRPRAFANALAMCCMSPAFAMRVLRPQASRVACGQVTGNSGASRVSIKGRYTVTALFACAVQCEALVADARGADRNCALLWARPTGVHHPTV